MSMTNSRRKRKQKRNGRICISLIAIMFLVIMSVQIVKLYQKEQEYTDKFANPYQAAQYGYIDDVIEPRNTRFRICRALAQLENKRETRPAKKHGNIPL